MTIQNIRQTLQKDQLPPTPGRSWSSFASFLLTQKKRRAGFSLLLSFSLKKKEERFSFGSFLLT
ncbi:MAG: hypothetical protein J6K72_10695 [Clostridia bacterium]|nr:hypothetical protein [Clostridia bacterium]